jgi:hypothetical protein
MEPEVNDKILQRLIRQGLTREMLVLYKPDLWQVIEELLCITRRGGISDKVDVFGNNFVHHFVIGLVRRSVFSGFAVSLLPKLIPEPVLLVAMLTQKNQFNNTPLDLTDGLPMVHSLAALVRVNAKFLMSRPHKKEKSIVI